MARGLIADRPVLGWGLGKTYYYFEPGSMEFFKLDITHNVGLDILLRTGAVGFLLFLAALATSIFGALRTWYRSQEELIAALALGVTAAVLGLIGKGMAESILEKYRIAVVLGLFLGILLSTATAGEQLARPPSRRRSCSTCAPRPSPPSPRRQPRSRLNPRSSACPGCDPSARRPGRAAAGRCSATEPRRHARRGAAR